MLKKRIIDTHCDTLMLYSKDTTGFVGGPWNVTLDKMQTYESYLGTFAMYYDATQTDEERKAQQIAYREAVAHLLANHPVRPVRTVADLETLDRDGGMGVLLSIENACVFDEDRAELDAAWEMGVRMISLTHFKDSQYGCGNAINNTPELDTGLTERGKAMVKLVEERGMIFDVSHLSFKSFWDVAEAAEKPFIASHSNAYAVRDHGRNLKDEMFKEIVRRGGLAGICFAPGFISTAEKVTVAHVADHVDHLCALGGEKCICIGGDLDGLGDDLIQGLHNCAMSWNLAEELLKRNYSEALVGDIMWGNAREFLKKMLPKA
ncbi:MAG: membrane dipeptidase [Clostridia bacterium]|nr:membrane dipeptidase [Clostridia bacterium]